LEVKTLSRKDTPKCKPGFGSSTARLKPDQKSFWTGRVSGPVGHPGPIGIDEPEGRLRTSPPRRANVKHSFELTTTSYRGTKAGGSMHRDISSMHALKAQIYRQYKVERDGVSLS